MTFGSYVRFMLRDSRGARGRMAYFALCLAVGVAAVVGTAALAEGIDRGFDQQSREVLGADFTIDAKRPLPDSLIAALDRVDGLEQTRTVETMTMVSVPAGEGRSRLVQVLVVTGRYPLHGELVTTPPGGLERHLTRETIVVEPDLLSALGIPVGEQIRLGTALLEVRATAIGGPQQLGFSSFLAPRLYLSREAFEQTGLVGFGSRVSYTVLGAWREPVSRADIDETLAAVEASVPDAPYLDFDAHHEIGRGRAWVGRMEGFVGLIALLSLVIGGIGVALIVRTWLSEKTRAMAVMRCLGMTPPQLLVLALAHVSLLALVGSLFGAAIGCTLPTLVRSGAPDLLPVEVVRVFPTAAVLRGVALGVGLSLAFALPALSAIWRVSPARVLRSDAEPLPPHRGVQVASIVFLVAGVFAAAWVQADQTLHAVWFTAGFLVLVGVLFLAARLLIRMATRIPRGRLSPYLVHGLSALARPGAGTVGAIVALGLGTMVVTAVALVETRLQDAITAQIPTEAPSVFLIDIQPEQREGVRNALANAGASSVDLVPVVMARIAALDGRSATDIAQAGGGGWSLRREQRLTWRKTLTPDNEIVAGALWSEPDLPEVSVEERFARRLGIGLGSRITFDVQGVPVTLHVTSIRVVEWQSLSLNFFLVVEPGVLEDAPALYLASANVPMDVEQRLQDRIAASFGNVSVLRVRAVLEQILELLGRVALGLRLLGGLTVLAGLAILAGAISASVLHRAREVALLKSLGITRGGATALLLTEYGISGALAGLIGAAGALLLAWTWLEFVADVEVSLPWLAIPVAMLGMGVLTAACGVLANLRALRVAPARVLRS